MKNLTVKTTGLTGKQWLARMERGGYRVSVYAKDILLSKEFDAARLKKDIKQEIAFVSVKDLGKEYATAQEIKDYAKSKGYDMPTPELALLIRESMLNEEIKALDVWYIAVLHDSIKDFDGKPGVLRAHRNDGVQWLNTGWDSPGSRWNDAGLFAFPVSASGSQISTK